MSGVTYALIVAVESYNDPKSFPRVTYAEKDAMDFKNALLQLEVQEDDITLLLSGRATKISIEKEVFNITWRLLENDRVIIYFAGHGAYERENYLVPVDAYKTDIASTCVPLSGIFDKLRKSLAKRNILFLDCCHSGFEPSADSREIDQKFMADELVYEYKSEEYCIGFASCKSNQKSISHPQFKNGVWSHFLIEALSGRAEAKIYESGLLFSDKLQNYLNKKTYEFVKLNTDDKKDQVPIIFGNLTDRFIIADLNRVFDKKVRELQADDISLTKVTLLGSEEGRIKSLPGFNKKLHTVPTNNTSATDGFIRKVGHPIVEQEISALSQDLKNKLKYKLKDIEANVDSGSGAINTPDFTYSIEITQSENEPSEYWLVRKLANFRDLKVMLSADLNGVFSKHFDQLEFALSRSIDIAAFIERVEDLESGSLNLSYDASNLTTCKLSISGLNFDILINEKSITIEARNVTSPAKLISCYKEMNKLFLENPGLKMLQEW